MKILIHLLIVLFATLAGAQTHREFTVDVTYDGLGRVETVKHPMTGKIQRYTYNKLTGHVTVAYGGETIVSNTVYNQMALPALITIAPITPWGEGVITRDYDTLSRLTSQQVTIGGSVQYHAYNLTYNAWGFLASEQRNDSGYSGTITYGYGSRGELTSFELSDWSNTQYQYDTNGNLTHRTTTYGNPPLPPALTLPDMSAQYNPSNNRNLAWEYDAAGRVTADERFEYHYNDLDRIEKIVNRETGSIISHYLYDGNGGRIREITGNQVIYYIRMPDGKLLSREIWETRLDGGYVAFHEDFIYHNNRVILSVLHQNGQELKRTYQYRDRMGNSAFTVTSGPGGGFDWFFYSPYGYNMDTWSEEAPHHQYTGHERDKATGLDYMHARYCNWNYGRFTRPDPGYRFSLISPYSFNMYAYAQGNPINAWDPNGEAIETLWDAFSFGLGISSFHQNMSEGKYLSAAVDGIGVGLDGLAMGVPLIPGGAGAALKGLRKGAQEAAEFAAKKLPVGGQWVVKNRNGMSPRSVAFQEKITGKVGTGAKGMIELEYNGVEFDGFDEIAGVFLEAKGQRFEKLFDEKFGPAIIASQMKQATRQLKAAGGIPVRWHFAEKEAANRIRKIFKRNGINVDVVHTEL